MAIFGLNSNDQDEYITRLDPCRTKETGATVFYSEPVPNAIMTRITDQQSKSTINFGEINSQVTEQRLAHRNRECFRFGVRGWDNYFTSDGSPIIFRTMTVMEGGEQYEVVHTDCLNQMVSGTIQEVGNHVWQLNTLTDDERKKSEQLLSQFGGFGTSTALTVNLPTEDNEDARDQQNDQTEAEVSKTNDLPTDAAMMPTPASTTGKTPRRTNGKTAAPGGSV